MKGVVGRMAEKIIAKYVMTSNTTCFPYFDEDATGNLPSNITYTDVNNGDGTTTRTLYSNESPSMMYFYEDSNILEILEFDISNQTDLSYGFFGCRKLKYINANSWDTSNITTISRMFQDCIALTELNINNWDTSNVTDLHNTFHNCRSLESLDLSCFNTSSVTRIDSMFYGCTNLTLLDISNFNTNKVTDMNNMFYNCTSLNYIGMIYSDKTTCEDILTVASSNNLNSTVYVQDTKADEYGKFGNMVVADYISQSIKINLPQALESTDKLYWDKTKGKYCIQQNANIIETNITQKITFDTYNPYIKIVTDEVELSPSNISVELAMKEDQ